MDIEVHNEHLRFDLYGLSGNVVGHDYGGAGKKLMDELWRRVRENGLPHKGINFWVYDSDSRMSTCIELKDASSASGILNHLPVEFAKYGYFKHVGRYDKLGDVHRGMDKELKARRLIECGPRIERYGDWTENENELETGIFIGLK